mmetsp:Transcript_34368/g.110445  ORF Transcript_34368/g.110445 Transcript_34368/m.110445 type:complete len:133 (-) Transcript_34368:270-668(-)
MMTRSFLLGLLGFLVASVTAFVGPQPRATKTTLFAARELSDKEKKEQYWQGEWVCADCGYIYDRKIFGGRYFEEQTYGFKCPQCSGPRRRYAKKIGDTVGVTLDGGDGPILFWSGLGFLATIAFGFYATYFL